MKIGIISDAHLFHKYAITPKSYLNILTNSFKDVDFIVDCGDLTDKYTLTAPQLNELFDIFSFVNKPLYIVAGNHDSLNKTTIANILELNNNIKVITEPIMIDSYLFIPYTNNMTDLFKKLNNIVTKQANIMFSHLTITDNIYADISYKNLKKLFKYSNNIFNGHIHDIDDKNTIYGNFCNIGSCSSLTYGDNHIPCYIIYDTETNKYERHTIKDSIIHCNFSIKEDSDVDKLLDSINIKTKDFYLCCKISLSNSDENIERRKTISNKLKDNNKVINVTFSYIKSNSKIADKIQNDIIDANKINQSVTSQFIDLFETKNNIEMIKEIKEYLL